MYTLLGEDGKNNEETFNSELRDVELESIELDGSRMMSIPREKTRYERVE